MGSLVLHLSFVFFLLLFSEVFSSHGRVLEELHLGICFSLQSPRHGLHFLKNQSSYCPCSLYFQSIEQPLGTQECEFPSLTEKKFLSFFISWATLLLNHSDAEYAKLTSDAVDCPEWIVPFNVFKSLAEEITEEKQKIQFKRDDNDRIKQGPALPSPSPVVTEMVKVDNKLVQSGVLGTEEVDLMGMEACGNEDDECLKRRMVAEAHLDYIYTQHLRI